MNRYSSVSCLLFTACVALFSQELQAQKIEREIAEKKDNIEEVIIDSSAAKGQSQPILVHSKDEGKSISKIAAPADSSWSAVSSMALTVSGCANSQ